MTPSRAELDLGRSALGRDPDALRALWREHRGWIAGVLLAHKSRQADLEDLLQDVAMTMVSRISDVRDPGAIPAWLRMIALNTARADGRERTRRDRLDKAARRIRAQSTSDDGFSDVDRDEAQRLLDLACELPEAYREPLILRCVRGMTYRQVARAMELPETTVETRIARARRMLRERLSSADQRVMEESS